MQRKTLLAWPLVYGLIVVACSNTPQTPSSPSAASLTDAFLNTDGSSVKASAPTALQPDGVLLNTRRPTLSFENARTAAVTGVTFNYEIEVQDAAGNIVYSRIVPGTSSGRTEHTVETDAAYDTTLWWRTRGTISEEEGPWSYFAMVRTPVAPAPAPPTVAPVVVSGGGLPFPVPAACGPGGGFGCAAAIAAVSAEWQRCASGSGVHCHRFTRQVVYALSLSDPNWTLIQASPGGHSCNCFTCGPSDGSMFREDTAVYGGGQVFDMIVGAGGPSPSLTWSAVPGPRPGDLPTNAPLCQ